MKDDDNGLLELAEAAERVIGSDDTLFEHRENPGTWFFIGGAIAAAAVALHVSPWLVGVLAFLGGWALNEREQRGIKKRVADRQRSRQFG